MKYVEIPIMIDNEEEEKRLDDLVKRFRKINHWKEKDVLTFAFNSYQPLHDLVLTSLERMLDQYEREAGKQIVFLLGGLVKNPTGIKKTLKNIYKYLRINIHVI